MVNMDVLVSALRQEGAVAVGCIRTERLDYSGEEKSLVIAAFPYFAGSWAGNLSVYARGEDYHKVLRRRMEAVANGILTEYQCSADTTPLDERRAAEIARIAMRGKNGLMIVPGVGSLVFLGSILAKDELPEIFGSATANCVGCGKCVRACPVGAIGEDGIDAKRCLSDVTQRKGELTREEIHAIAQSGCLWGCDICQKVCPENANIPITKIAEFADDLIDNLPENELILMSAGEIERKYASRPFVWRGGNILKRNAKILLDELGGNDK